MSGIVHCFYRVKIPLCVTSVIKIFIPGKPVLDFKGGRLDGLAKRVANFIYAHDHYMDVNEYTLDRLSIASHVASASTPENAHETSTLTLTDKDFELLPVVLADTNNFQPVKNTWATFFEIDTNSSVKVMAAIFQSLLKTAEIMKPNTWPSLSTCQTADSFSLKIPAARHFLKQTLAPGQLYPIKNTEHLYKLHQLYSPALHLLNDQLKKSYTETPQNGVYRIAQFTSISGETFFFIYKIQKTGKHTAVTMYIPGTGTVTFSKQNFLIITQILWQLFSVSEYSEIIKIPAITEIE